MSDFGQCFRAFLRNRKITQIEAAALLKIDQSTVSYYCRSKKPPRPHVLAHMAAKLGVTEEELLGEGKGECVRETSVKYPAPRDPGPGMEELIELKLRWNRHPEERDGMATAIRLLWKKRAEYIIEWLEKKP